MAPDTPSICNVEASSGVLPIHCDNIAEARLKNPGVSAFESACIWVIVSFTMYTSKGTGPAYPGAFVRRAVWITFVPSGRVEIVSVSTTVTVDAACLKEWPNTALLTHKAVAHIKSMQRIKLRIRLVFIKIKLEFM